jgi:hypothetical protein
MNHDQYQPRGIFRQNVSHMPRNSGAIVVADTLDEKRREFVERNQGAEQIVETIA